jgi:hypothetical protein
LSPHIAAPFSAPSTACVNVSNGALNSPRPVRTALRRREPHGARPSTSLGDAPTLTCLPHGTLDSQRLMLAHHQARHQRQFVRLPRRDPKSPTCLARNPGKQRRRIVGIEPMEPVEGSSQTAVVQLRGRDARTQQMLHQLGCEELGDQIQPAITEPADRHVLHRSAGGRDDPLRRRTGPGKPTYLPAYLVRGWPPHQRPARPHPRLRYGLGRWGARLRDGQVHTQTAPARRSAG